MDKPFGFVKQPLNYSIIDTQGQKCKGCKGCSSCKPAKKKCNCYNGCKGCSSCKNNNQENCSIM